MTRLAACAVACLATVGISPASAQEVWPDGFGFQWQIGYKQMGGGWGFCARLTRLDDTPIRYREE